MIVHWAEVDGAARGALHLTNVLPRPPVDSFSAGGAGAPSSSPPAAAPAALGRQLWAVAMADRAEALATALRVSVDVPPDVAHDFGVAALCALPVRVTVQNCLRDAAVGYSLHLAGAPDGPAPPSATPGAGPAPPTRLPSGDCFWLDCTRAG